MVQLARDFFFQEQVEVRAGFSPSCYIYSTTSFHLMNLLKIIQTAVNESGKQ